MAPAQSPNTHTRRRHDTQESVTMAFYKACFLICRDMFTKPWMRRWNVRCENGRFFHPDMEKVGENTSPETVTFHHYLQIVLDSKEIQPWERSLFYPELWYMPQYKGETTFPNFQCWMWMQAFLLLKTRGAKYSRTLRRHLSMEKQKLGFWDLQFERNEKNKSLET